jgi:cAMP-dependent protein kinase regulator
MDEYDIQRLADAFEQREYKQGDVVVRQGERGDTFFVIEDGEAVFTVDGAVVGRGSVGKYFGELALLNATPRAATVTAASARLKVAVLDADAFNRLIPDAVRAALRAAAPQLYPQLFAAKPK